MYNEKGGQHNYPHIHAKYQDYNAVVDLEVNQKLLSNGEGYFKIDPLK